MPTGQPKKQTIASAKYQEKVGLVSKSYKLKRELVEEFASACNQAGVAQSYQISTMMQEFIKKIKNETP